MARKKGVTLVVAVIVLVGLVLGAVPGIIGGMFEERLKGEIQRAAEQQPQLDWKVTHYERDWFGARAESELTYRPEGTDESLSLTLAHRIDHGPGLTQASLIRMAVQPTDNPGWERLREQVFDGRDPLRLTYWLGATASHSLRLHSPDIGEVALPDQEGTITWDGLEADLNAGRDLDSVAGDIRIPGVRLNQPDGQFRMDGWRLQGGIDRLRPYVWVGDVELKGERFALDAATDGPPDHVRVDLRKLSVSSETRQDNGLVAGTGHLSTGSLQAQNFRIDSLELREKAERLSPAFLESSARAFQELNTDMEPETPPAVVLPRLLSKLRDLPYTELAAHEPRYEITKLEVTTSAGTVSGGGQASLEPIAEDGEIGDFVALAGQARAEAHLAAPKGLVRRIARNFARQRVRKMAEQRGRQLSSQQLSQLAGRIARQQLQQLRQQGLLKRRDGQYRIEAGWDGQTVSINGREILRPFAAR